jgi:hypothetical protein
MKVGVSWKRVPGSRLENESSMSLKTYYTAAIGMKDPCLYHKKSIGFPSPERQFAWTESGTMMTTVHESNVACIVCLNQHLINNLPIGLMDKFLPV